MTVGYHDETFQAERPQNGMSALGGGLDEQSMLIEQDGARYFRPAYFGDDWIGIRFDLGDTNWDAVADWLGRSWRAVAPKKLTGLMDVADEF